MHRRDSDIRAVLDRWLPEGMRPSDDLQHQAAAAIDALTVAGSLWYGPIIDADDTTTAIGNRLLHRLTTATTGADTADVVTDEIGRLVTRLAVVEHAYHRLRATIDTVAGRTLDYPPLPADGDTDARATGDHTAETLLAELATELTDLRSRRPTRPRYHRHDRVLYGTWTRPRYVAMAAWDADRRTWVYLATCPDRASIETTEDLLRPWLDENGQCWCARVPVDTGVRIGHKPGLDGCVFPPGHTAGDPDSYQNWITYRDDTTT